MERKIAVSGEDELEEMIVAGGHRTTGIASRLFMLASVMASTSAMGDFKMPTSKNSRYSPLDASQETLPISEGQRYKWVGDTTKTSSIKNIDDSYVYWDNGQKAKIWKVEARVKRGTIILVNN